MSGPRHRLCLVEDDEIMGESLTDRFALEGYECDWYRRGGEALAAVPNRRYSVIVSDIRLPDMSGEDVFRALAAACADLAPVVFITGFGAVDRAVQLLKAGAADYITKPFDIDDLLDRIAALCARRPLPLAGGEPTLGVSPAMLHLQEALPRLAKHAAAILITGESGVGKEQVAKEIHRLSSAARKSPFVAVNCGAFPETLLEAELFGHEKGAFTGAGQRRAGVFEQAHGGTLFLDEIGEMPLPMQVKLLRAVQERTVVRLGGGKPVPVQIRLICATNRDLKAQVESGCFREDLYYRINLVHLRVPPLRERREDVLWLARIFLDECSSAHGGERRSLTEEAERALLAYPWPGNVRELKHCIERACIVTANPVLQPVDLFEAGVQPAPQGGAPANLAAYLAECERAYIHKHLQQAGGHISQTAASLGISRKNLWEKMRKLGLKVPGEARED